VITKNKRQNQGDGDVLHYGQIILLKIAGTQLMTAQIQKHATLNVEK